MGPCQETTIEPIEPTLELLSRWTRLLNFGRIRCVTTGFEAFGLAVHRVPAISVQSGTSVASVARYNAASSPVLAHPFPYARIDAICRRKDAIFPATVVGKPRQEDFYLGDHLQELLSPFFPLVMPGVIDLWSYGETGYHSLSAAVVRERYGREAMVSAFRILGEG